MPDSSKKFHEFALKSVLFKGRTDWYFCYLKAEKIAHVLAILTAGSDAAEEFVRQAAELPGSIAYLAAGDVDIAAVLADVFSLLSAVRLGASQGVVGKEAAAIVCKEYEMVAERLVIGSHPSPFITNEEFRLGVFPELEPAAQHPGLAIPIKDIKDSNSAVKRQSATMTERMSLILEVIRKNKQVSIKEIGAVVRDCSEKTIQRELGVLIEQGLVRKVGERRWSVYLPL